MNIIEQLKEAAPELEFRLRQPGTLQSADEMAMECSFKEDNGTVRSFMMKCSKACPLKILVPRIRNQVAELKKQYREAVC